MCDIWDKNKLKNPLTNRTIKVNGPVYKDFKQFCINKIKNCEELSKNKNTNPLTKKKLIYSSKILDFF